MKKLVFFKAPGLRSALLLILPLVPAVILYPFFGWGTGALTDYTGRAFFPVVVPPPNVPDTSVIVFPQPLPDTDYKVVIGGTMLSEVPGSGGVTYDIYLDGYVVLNPPQNPTANGFTLAASWIAYVSGTNREAQVPVGSWNNRAVMFADLGIAAFPIEPDVDWRIIRS